MNTFENSELTEILGTVQHRIDCSSNYSHWKKGDRIKNVIGSGAFAIVCPLYNEFTSSDDSVLKIISLNHFLTASNEVINREDLINYIQREIKTMEKYSGEKNFVKIHWFESFEYITSTHEKNTLVIIKMERLMPLSNYLDNIDFLKHSFSTTSYYIEKLVINISVQILMGLSLMAQQGDVHRDLKVENILVDTRNGLDKPIFKIADFGIVTNTHSGTKFWAGTEQTLPLENIERQSTPYQDQYSLGAIMFYLLNDCQYIDMRVHVNNLSLPPKHGIHALQKIVLKAFDANPNRRFRNITSPTFNSAIDEYTSKSNIKIVKTWADCMKDELLKLNKVIDDYTSHNDSLSEKNNTKLTNSSSGRHDGSGAKIIIAIILIAILSIYVYNKYSSPVVTTTQNSTTTLVADNQNDVDTTYSSSEYNDSNNSNGENTDTNVYMFEDLTPYKGDESEFGAYYNSNNRTDNRGKSDYSYIFIISNYQDWDEKKNTLTYDLDNQFKTLTFTLGLSETSKNTEQHVYFVFYGDGEKIGQTKTFTAGVKSHKYTLNVSGVKDLQIIHKFDGSSYSIDSIDLVGKGFILKR